MPVINDIEVLVWEYIPERLLEDDAVSTDQRTLEGVKALKAKVASLERGLENYRKVLRNESKIS